VKPEIHPRYYNDTKVICSCGNTWTTGSTQPEIRVELCSTCHPFFTGQQRIVDSAGQVERFHRRFGRPEETLAVGEGAVNGESNEVKASAS